MSATQASTVEAVISKKMTARVKSFDWKRISQDLDARGSAMSEHLLSPDECQRTAALYTQDELCRSRVEMGRHGFGRGEYKYFSYPLPSLIAELRTAIYSHLVPRRYLNGEQKIAKQNGRKCRAQRLSAEAV